MRKEKEVMKILLEYARANELIKAVTLEGSRSNPNIPKDQLQDYDITFIVEAIDPFRKDESWLSTFGNLIILQKPEDMELFPAEITGFSYPMILDDYNKIDITLVPIELLDEYLKSDKLIKVLLDKHGIIQDKLIPTDVDYHIKKPTMRMYDECCNEF